MSAVLQKDESIQLSFNFSHIVEKVVDFINAAENEPSFAYDMHCAQLGKTNNLLENSSTGIEEKTVSLLVGESSTDMTLEEADSLFLNNSGYILFALQAIYIAAKDVKEGGKENPSAQQVKHYESALKWLNGEEDSIFPFDDCVKLLDYELRFQSMDEVNIPDIANNPEVISDWIKNSPEDAAYYLKNYQSLFNSERRSRPEEAESYEQLRQSSPHQQGVSTYERATP